MYGNNELTKLMANDELYEYLEKNKENITYILEAFSQYIVSTDKDYLYNKAYIDSYIITFGCYKAYANIFKEIFYGFEFGFL